MVFFRRSDVVVTGEVYDPTRFPRIDLEKGGSIQGVIDALNRIIAITVPPIPLVWQEGGTIVVGAHGVIGHEADVVDYRDMVTIVRDRVQDGIKKGQTLAQIRQADPVKGYRRPLRRRQRARGRPTSSSRRSTRASEASSEDP